MVAREYLKVACVVLAASTVLSVDASAKSFKSKYYKECYADVRKAVKLITPKESMSAKANKLGGLFSKVGSVAGLGGVGGSVYKAAGTINKIQKYSGIIDNAGAFSAQMATEHPDPNDRFAAYGTYMSNDGKNISQVQQAVTVSQECYEEKYTQLSADVAAGDMKKRKAKKRLKEIQKGTRASGDALLMAMNHLNKNLNSFNQTLGAETQYLGMSQLEIDAHKRAGVDPVHVQNLFAKARGDKAAMNQQIVNQYKAAGVDTSQLQHLYSQSTVAVPSVGGFANLGMLSGLAGAMGQKAEGSTVIANSGLQAVAVSSQEYLALHESLTKIAEKQRLLELKVNKGLN